MSSRLGEVIRIDKLPKRARANMEALGELQSSHMENLQVEHLASFSEAVAESRRKFEFQGNPAGTLKRHVHIQKHALTGDPAAAAEAIDKADALLAEAMALDPRLCKRASWTRSEDGLFADAGLVASGDDSPCFDRQRARLGDVADHGEPVKVVISTDGGRPDPAALIAFAAVARIVMQFRPLAIYWQGAWLRDNGTDAGYVFLSPLLENTFDLARLQYALTDPTRDGLSFDVFFARCVIRDRRGNSGLGRHAERSYMPGAHFVPREGIRADAADVARVAAAWLGIESIYWHTWEEKKLAGSAIQSLPKTYEAIPETDEERAEREKRWKESDERRAKERQEEARKRELQHN